MKDDMDKDDGRPVPSRRMSRLMGLGGVAVSIAGGAALNGAKQLAGGKRPKASDLFLTPSNAMKLTKQLSNMRGAAMKLGQMISMDSGDFLPKELADILARLRASAVHMPAAQLAKVLKSELGPDWLNQFEHFQTRPIAAASIGQVHRAILPNGDDVAIKVQYPGVRESIDSDVKNVASLLRMSGLVPASMDVKPIIEAGRRQLHQEADYIREADYLCRFGRLLSDDESFQVPEFYPELSTDKVLAMSYIKSRPIEEMLDAPQDVRNRIVRNLMSLTLQELFRFKLMQTDPNFANYRYNEETEQIVLLDFGATREIGDELSSEYRTLMETCLSGDVDTIMAHIAKMGLMPSDMSDKPRGVIHDMIAMSIAPLGQDEVFDFGKNKMALDLRDRGLEIAGNRELWHVPPPETVFLQRKLGGMYMLATRLGAQINVAQLIRDHIAV
jgi:predicted unusual protein kinase regulating ubiquinone biosynthesis (AarF/ABC1/UbiB family)